MRQVVVDANVFVSFILDRNESQSAAADELLLRGVVIVNDCPLSGVLERWPEPFSSLADAAIVALSTTNDYDSVATFDQVLSRRMKRFDVTPYW